MLVGVLHFTVIVMSRPPKTTGWQISIRIPSPLEKEKLTIKVLSIIEEIKMCMHLISLLLLL